VGRGSQDAQAYISAKDRELEELLRNAATFFQGRALSHRATNKELAQPSEREREERGGAANE
jgi:hypothetical protein